MIKTQTEQQWKHTNDVIQSIQFQNSFGYCV